MKLLQDKKLLVLSCLGVVAIAAGALFPLTSSPQQEDTTFSIQAIGGHICSLSERGEELKKRYERIFVIDIWGDRQRMIALRRSLEQKLRQVDPQTEIYCVLKQIETQISFMITNLSNFTSQRDLERYKSETEEWARE